MMNFWFHPFMHAQKFIVSLILNTPFWKDVLKNQQNDELIKKWREILIGLLVSDDVMAIWQ